MKDITTLMALAIKWREHNAMLDKFDGDRRGISQAKQDAEDAILALCARITKRGKLK